MPTAKTDPEDQADDYSYPWGVRWLEVPGMVQMVLATYVPGKGWLVTKRGIIYGGHHGEPPMLEDDVDTIVERLTPELRSGIRAMQHRLSKEHLGTTVTADGKVVHHEG